MSSSSVWAPGARNVDNDATGSVNIGVNQIKGRVVEDVLRTYAVTKSITLAQVVAGITLLPGVAGKRIIVHSIVPTSIGSAPGGAALAINDTTASPVSIVSFAYASFSTVMPFPCFATGATLGVGFGTKLADGKGIAIPATAGMTTTDGFVIDILFSIVDA